MTDKIEPSAAVYAAPEIVLDPREQLLGFFKAGQNLIIEDYNVKLVKDLDFYQVISDADPTKFVDGHFLLDLHAKGYFETVEEDAPPLEFMDDEEGHGSLIELRYHDRTPNRAAVDAFVKNSPELIELLLEYRGCKLMFDEDRLLPVRVLFEGMARMTDPTKEIPKEVSMITGIPVKDYPKEVYARLLASAKVLAGPDGGAPIGKVDPRDAMTIGETMIYHEIHIIRAEKIAKYGFTMQGSETKEGQFFLYTIGLNTKAGVELIIAGNIGYENAASIVAQLARRMKDGEQIDLDKEFTLENFVLAKKPVNGVMLDDINDTTPATPIRFKFKEWTHLGKATDEERAIGGYELELIFDKYTRAIAYKTGSIVQVLVADAENRLPGEEGYSDKVMNQELLLVPKKD